MNLVKIKKVCRQKLEDCNYIYRTECYVIEAYGYIVKLFKEEKIRDITYKAQTKAAKYKLGPATYGKIKIGPLYGYISEKVYVLPDVYNGDKLYRDWDKDVWTLQTKLRKIGIDFTDGHWLNIGWSDECKVLCIDFGPISCDS